MKYKFNFNTKVVNGVTLHQIECVTSFSDVKDGDVGGWIEKESNLSQYGNAWIYGNARVYGNACVSDDARVFDDARVSGNAWIYGDAWIYGNARVSDDARVYGNARVFIGLWRSDDIIELQIKGSMHEVNSPDGRLIRIGCQEHSPKHWLSHFEVIGKKNGYSCEQIKEYKMYIDLFCQILPESN